MFKGREEGCSGGDIWKMLMKRAKRGGLGDVKNWDHKFRRKTLRITCWWLLLNLRTCSPALYMADPPASSVAVWGQL